MSKVDVMGKGSLPARLAGLLHELSLRQIVGQILFYVLFFGFIGYLIDLPEYEYLAPGEAVIKVAVRHTGKLLGECRELSASEVQALPPNMRRPMVCPRERSPVKVEFSLGEKVMFVKTIDPAGLHNDGISATYESFMVDKGALHLRLRIDDDERAEGFSHQFADDFVLDAGQILVIEFNNGFHITRPDGKG